MAARYHGFAAIFGTARGGRYCAGASSGRRCCSAATAPPMPDWRRRSGDIGLVADVIAYDHQRLAAAGDDRASRLQCC
jgi:hypothetical protein